ncbi:MAG: ubiquinol-cytochrome c reductase iron-sulfur subunit [Acidobacteriota bacterium]
MAEHPGSTRRTFVNWFLGGSVGALLAAVVYPVVRFLSPPETAEASANEVEVGPVNDPDFVEKGFKIVSFGAEPVIVVRAGEDDFRAFAATCTHLSCIVEYRQDRRLIWCNCHDGKFDLQGNVTGGPPPRRLERYTVHKVARGTGQPDAVVVSRS